MVGGGHPATAAVDRREDLARPHAEVEAERIAVVAAERLAQHGQVGVAIGQAAAERPPGGAGVAGLVDPQLAVGSDAVDVGDQRNDEGAVGVERIDLEREAEIGGEPSTGCRRRRSPASSRRRRRSGRRRRGTACRDAPAAAARGADCGRSTRWCRPAPRRARSAAPDPSPPTARSRRRPRSATPPPPRCPPPAAPDRAARGRSNAGTARPHPPATRPARAGPTGRGSDSQVRPSSVLLNSAAGATPAHSTPGSSAASIGPDPRHRGAGVLGERRALGLLPVARRIVGRDRAADRTGRG